jgi:uncharacterized Zn finger protein
MAFFCPSCNSDKKLGVIKHEVITVLADSNTEKHNMELPVSIGAIVKCFDCGAEFLTSITLEYEVNPF